MTFHWLHKAINNSIHRRKFSSDWLKTLDLNTKLTSFRAPQGHIQRGRSDGTSSWNSVWKKSRPRGGEEDGLPNHLSQRQHRGQERGARIPGHWRVRPSHLRVYKNYSRGCILRLDSSRGSLLIPFINLVRIMCIFGMMLNEKLEFLIETE